ncbi:universal stress protein [Arthrobacter sp. NyZ413]|uniref:universal stress protein n=1 Tax=Arthrobacter sp. NyZ413 TaxID=3144669 RepID=UPI003BF7811E
MKKQILVGVNGSAVASNAADWAAERARDRGLQLNLFSTVPEPWSYPDPGRHETARAQARNLLRSEAKGLVELNPSLDIVTTLGSGEPAETMRTLSADAEMVVVGTDRHADKHGEGFGSVSFQVAVISHCPVVVVPLASGHPSSGVVVGIDGSDDSDVALESAASEAQRIGEELVLVHAAGKPGPEVPGSPAQGAPPDAGLDGYFLLSSSAEGLAVRYPGLVVREVLDLERPPAEALLDASAHARLLVIGCKGRGGARVLVGSVAQHVLLNIQCPTLITRPALDPA